MPEFILDHGSTESAAEFRKLDSFTQGYLEALFFTSTGTGDDGDMSNATLADLAPETWNRILSDCAKFQAMCPVDLDEACDEARINGYDMASAGRDFWFTRNGHGVGFWEQDGACWDSLDRAAESFGNVDAYLGDDGKVYLS